MRELYDEFMDWAIHELRQGESGGPVPMQNITAYLADWDKVKQRFMCRGSISSYSAKLNKYALPKAKMLRAQCKSCTSHHSSKCPLCVLSVIEDPDVVTLATVFVRNDPGMLFEVENTTAMLALHGAFKGREGELYDKWWDRFEGIAWMYRCRRVAERGIVRDSGASVSPESVRQGRGFARDSGASVSPESVRQGRGFARDSGASVSPEFVRQSMACKDSDEEELQISRKRKQVRVKVSLQEESFVAEALVDICVVDSLIGKSGKLAPSGGEVCAPSCILPVGSQSHYQKVQAAASTALTLAGELCVKRRKLKDFKGREKSKDDFQNPEMSDDDEDDSTFTPRGHVFGTGKVSIEPRKLRVQAAYRTLKEKTGKRFGQLSLAEQRAWTLECEKSWSVAAKRSNWKLICAEIGAQTAEGEIVDIVFFLLL